MAFPSVTYTFANSTTADATQVNQNFTDIINGLSDATKNLSISALTTAGTANLGAGVILGASSANDITVNGSIASSIPFKTNATYNVGAATLAPLSYYIGQGTKSIRLVAPTIANSWTMTLPVDVPTTANSVMTSDASGVTSWVQRTTISTVAKTTTYTATLADDVILCSASANWVLTIPSAALSTGKLFRVKKTDNTAFTITLTPVAGNIDASGSLALSARYEEVEIVSDGSNWHIISHTTPSYTYQPTFYGTTNAQQATTGAYVKIPFTATYDTHAGWVTDTYTCPSAGYYQIKATLPIFNNTAALNNVFFGIHINGSLAFETYLVGNQGYALNAVLDYITLATITTTIDVRMKSGGVGAWQLTGGAASANTLATISISKLGLS